MKAAFRSNGRQWLLATTQGLWRVEEVEDLDALLKRGCKELQPHLAKLPEDDSVRKRLSFCKP